MLARNTFLKEKDKKKKKIGPEQSSVCIVQQYTVRAKTTSRDMSYTDYNYALMASMN